MFLIMLQKLEKCQEMGKCITGFGYIPPSIPLIMLCNSVAFSLLKDAALIKIITKHLHLRHQAYGFHISLFSAFG